MLATWPSALLSCRATFFTPLWLLRATGPALNSPRDSRVTHLPTRFPSSSSDSWIRQIWLVDRWLFLTMEFTEGSVWHNYVCY
ncbi:hypothetical protein OE88DRAFT_1039974 [Heliocybe sulcata]|uniref:Secreted protein n=1 Tax=Heliocybe sulcata TaxID=5364 RepID=A0A5C3MLI0_9AGAM|nr:hypothetical protein OE88DRAFT_1039974 [Heliocybe sulcata]